LAAALLFGNSAQIANQSAGELMTINLSPRVAAPDHSIVSLSNGAGFWIVAGTACLVRFAASFVFDLNLMESYGAVMGRHLSLSYLDHPPITWWLIGAVTRLFHSEAATVVRAPFILLFIASSWLLYNLTRQLFGSRAALYATSAFSLAPLFNLWVGALALTDGPEVFFVLASLNFIAKAIFERGNSAIRSRWLWLGGGFLFGLALASKYTAILLVPGLLLFLVSSGRGYRRWLTRPEPYLAGCVALIPLLPVLIWNAQHGWASFLFQGGRASPDHHLHIALMVRWLGMQILYLQPLICLALIIAAVGGLAHSNEQKVRFFRYLSLFPLIFFPAAILLSSHGLRGFHWGAVGWLMLFPPLGALLAEAQNTRTRWLKGGIVAAIATFTVALAALISHASTGWIAKAAAPFNATAFENKDPVLVELFDWSDLTLELKRRGVDPSRTFVAGIRWEACAKAAYIVRDDYRFLCIAKNNLHFAYIADPESFRNWDAIVVDLSADLGRVKASIGASFDKVELMEPVELHFFGRSVMPLKLYLAKNFSPHSSSD
jgi:4-amino-4-deoxy-L-arabinose transferase-like glycosyltransferase